MRAALQALLKFQTQTSVAGLPACGPAQLAQDLAQFPAWCVQREYGRAWAGNEQAWWDRVAAALVDSAAAQPQVAVRGRWSAADTEAPPAAEARWAGPLYADLAALLRDPLPADDESLELDRAVRWWEGARRAGLPVDPDFGECWRALEWMGLYRSLVAMGLRCRGRHEAGADEGDLRAALAPGLAAAAKVALRYGPLKPLVRLLQPLQGDAPLAGFTF